MSSISFPRSISTRRPKIIISEETWPRLEALAENALESDPAPAGRLLDELDRASIVNQRKMPTAVATIGNFVTYRDGTTGQERTVMLVYPVDADIAHQKISVLTPIGVALLGLKEGASYFWDTREGERRMLTVVRVTPAVPDIKN